ncbi:MAG: glycoside hydrolase family 18 protein [Planctomycetota bacterium]
MTALRPGTSRVGRSWIAAGLLLAPLAPLSTAAAQEPRGASVHAAQVREMASAPAPPSEDAAEARALAARGPGARPFTGSSIGAPLTAGPTPLAAAPSRIDDEFIVFGYLQNENQVFHLRWHALTHVGSRFVGFDSTGRLTSESAFTGRSSYLKAGGAAEAAGVKVVLVLAQFDDGAGGALQTVMTSPARRATLVGELVSILASDSYSHGVSIDFEFSWGPAVRDGITAFMQELRAGLDALGPGYELSIYTNAIFSSSQWDFDAQTGITPSIDYMLYSMYDWASGSVARAISDFDNCLGSSRMHGYLDDGLPPEKLVPVISAYSRRWSGTTVYGGSGFGATSSGFTDALYDVTLNPSIGPSALGYVRGDEAGWYGWNDGTSRVRTFDSPDAMELEVRHALSLQDPSGTWSGRRLGGVGFWSLMWMAEFTSVDPRTGGTVSRTRTYPHVYELCHEVLSPPGTRRFLLEAFDGLDFRWRDPNESPDTAGDFDANTTRSLVPSLEGRGNAMRVDYDFEGGSGNRAVLAHEVLASPIAPSVVDTNAVLGRVARETRLSALAFTPVGRSDYSVRMLVIDADGEIEASPPRSLGPIGWRTLSWDLDDPASVQPFTTSEPAFQSGDGVLDTAGGGARDIGFFGFAIEGDGATTGTILFDDVAREALDPGRRAYRINELRYSDPAVEFVEVHGPAGPVPPGLSLRVYDATDGSVARTIPVPGPIPDDGSGFGLFVIGDPGVPNVDSSIGFSPVADDLPDVDPSALQLFDVGAGLVHDSLVYEAFGGLDELVRREARGVTGSGWPWTGEVADGRDAFGQRYALGRYPDGRDTRRNARDFSFQMASPGAPNGNALTLPATFDFESAFPTGFQTFDVPRRASPPAAGLPPSSNGGLAWRCLDETGGGVIGVLGDAALGASTGVRITGEVYVPRATEPAQATAVGICGRQGSNFFSSTASAQSGYESGYWLIYQNRPGVGLGTGRPDHAGVWELVHATHDNMDGAPVDLLYALPNFILGVDEGDWARFEIVLDPFTSAGAELVVRVNDVDLYAGPLPEGGPRSGGFQVGFRENHPGPPAQSEGTWIDGLEMAVFGPAVPAGGDPP